MGYYLNLGFKIATNRSQFSIYSESEKSNRLGVVEGSHRGRRTPNFDSSDVSYKGESKNLIVKKIKRNSRKKSSCNEIYQSGADDYYNMDFTGKKAEFDDESNKNNLNFNVFTEVYCATKLFSDKKETSFCM